MRSEILQPFPNDPALFHFWFVLFDYLLAFLLHQSGSPNQIALLLQSARHMCVQRRAIPMLLRLKDLSLRAKIKFLRELPAHYQTPVSATPSASVHEEVATNMISSSFLQWEIGFVYHKIVKSNPLNHIPDFTFATSCVDSLCPPISALVPLLSLLLIITASLLRLQKGLRG